MTPYLLPYLAGVATLVVADLIWLGVLMRPFYTHHIGHLMSGTINWPAAIAFYLLYPLGLLIFAVIPNLGTSPLRVALFSALFGFFAYAVYDLTNHATLKNWPLPVTLIDITWGTFLTALIGFVIVSTIR